MAIQPSLRDDAAAAVRRVEPWWAFGEVKAADGSATHVGTDGYQIQTVDPGAGQVRPRTAADRELGMGQHG